MILADSPGRSAPARRTNPSVTVAGSWIAGSAVATNGQAFKIVNPANGEMVAEYALATTADVDAAVAAARGALPGWATATPADRSAVLARLAKLAAEHAEDLVAEEVARPASQCDLPPSSTCRAASTTSTSSRAPPAIWRARPPPSTPPITPRASGERRSASSDHRPLELPPADGGVEDVARVRRGLHGGDQARRDHPTDDADPGPAGQRGGLPDGVFNVVTGAGQDVGTALAGHQTSTW